MDGSSVATHAITFLVGTAVGAAGQYYAQLFTEKRHAQEKKSKRLREWQRVQSEMPDLVREMREDWQKPRGRFIHTLYTLHEGCRTDPSDTEGFVYYYETHPALDGYMAILEEFSFVQFVNQHGVIREYRVADEFVQFLLEPPKK